MADTTKPNLTRTWADNPETKMGLSWQLSQEILITKEVAKMVVAGPQLKQNS